jgi:protease IV
MRGRLPRYARLAYLNLSEALLRSLGRRPPYGVLTLEIAGDLSEEPVEYRLLGFSQRAREDYFDVLALLRWAREDPQVRGVLLRCGSVRTGWAKVQELRRSLMALRDAGKVVWVHLTQAGMREYLLATVAHQVVLAPAGTLDIAGLSSEVTFVAGALKKLGVEAEVIQMGRYKSAAETFTRGDMSVPHREMVESLIEDLYLQIVQAIADGRRMSPDDVRGVLDRGPFMGREAQERGLVDALLYADEAEEKLVAQCDGAATIEQRDYFARRGRMVRRNVLRQGRRGIGLLHVTGTVKMGESVPGPDAASATGASSVTRDLKELRERDDVRAVVLRIASPGGSGLASDLMWHEVVRTRQRKPVVVSFGDVAASGGYYVGVAGRPVIAEGGTITGSIGVIAGKALLRGLYEHLGVTKELITRGRHAALYSDYVPLGDEERERLQTEAEFFYADFLDKVADGRQLSREAVAAVAEGRVWSGRQALQHGLIDQLGGLEQAMDEAKLLAGIPPGELVLIERYPKPKRLWKLSLNLSPLHARLVGAAPWLRFVAGERIWAVLPFDFRFF